MITKNRPGVFPLLLSLMFAFWASGFIYRSSFLAIDGHRYFSLIDDAMISMRYAWNFTHGFGLVWNPGERVEGYSNLLAVLWMAIPSLVLPKSAAVLAMQLSGIPVMLGTAWATMKIARICPPQATARHSTLMAFCAFAGALSYYPLTMWALMGLEQGLLALLINCAVLLSLLYERTQQSRHLVLTALALGMSYLTRNDSLVFAVPIGIFLISTAGTRTSSSRKHLLMAALLYCGFIFGQAGFRYQYYGQLVPNTYTLKLVGMPILERLRNGAGFVGIFLKEVGVLALIVLVGIIRGFSRHKVYLASFMFAAVCYQIYTGGDYSNYWRIMSPAMPVLLVVLLQTVAGIIDAVEASLSAKNLAGVSSSITSLRPNALIVLIAILVGVGINFRFIDEILLKHSLGDDNWNGINTALAINAVTSPMASVGVFRAGVVPYYTGRAAVDFLGKADPYIASLPPDTSGRISATGMTSQPGHNKYDLNYSIKLRRPTYVEGFAWGSQDLAEWANAHYVAVKYDTVELSLLKGSSLVYWNKVTPIGR